jgi:hypothetical protein
MPQTYDIGEARYYWNQWNDGVASRSRIVTVNSNVTLTAYYNGPYYELTVASSPIEGIIFVVDGVPKTTPYTEWLLEGTYTLEMPETSNGYIWSHWLEDGDTSRVKTVTLSGAAWTGVFALPPSKPVGGFSFQTKGYITAQPVTLYLALTAILATCLIAIRRKTRKR